LPTLRWRNTRFGFASHSSSEVAKGLSAQKDKLARHIANNRQVPVVCVHDNGPPTGLRQSGDIGNATPAHLAGLKPQSPYLLMKANLIGARLNDAKWLAINSNLCAARCGHAQHRFGVSKSTHIAHPIKIEDVSGCQRSSCAPPVSTRG
jgi:hypothetical protein